MADGNAPELLDPNTVRSLAVEFQVSHPDAERIYLEALNELSGRARVSKYLSVLVLRRAKQALATLKRAKTESAAM